MKKRNFYLVIAFLICTYSTHAQIKLIGMSPRLAMDTVDVVEWQPLGTGALSRYPAPVNGWTNNTGLFDAINGNYYVSAITVGGGSLLTFQSVSNQITLSPVAQISNAAEIDMSNGKIYTIFDNAAGDLEVFEINPLSGNSTLVSTLVEPGIQEVTSNSTAFDSNNGIMYYFGLDGGVNYLYTLRLRSQPFSWTKIPLSTVINPVTQSPNPYFCANYDNVQNILYSVTPEFDSTFTSVQWKILETNVSTGALTTRGILNTFPYFADLGSSVFDQNSGTLILTGPDNLTSGGQRVVFFNTATNTYLVDSMPTPIYEIVCDNQAFAQNRYGAVAGNQVNKSDVLDFYPNPAQQSIRLRLANMEHQVVIQIENLSGQRIMDRTMHPTDGLLLDLESIPSGVYRIYLQQGQVKTSQRLVVR